MKNLIYKIPLHPPFSKGEKVPLFYKEGLGEIFQQTNQSRRINEY
jgi:hypothetical protein